ncbi:MAG TPA: hypothetical protein VFC67_10215 [Prolixibacteraceae bacterium]|nr:hypothetical protein [Prolixibacteraceae bacterium]
MGKKILIGITIVLISVLLAGWYFFTREAKYFGTSAFGAVPENVSVIVRVQHLGNYTDRSLSNPIWKAYSGFPGVASLYQQLVFADSLFKTYPEAKNSFNDKDLTIMFGGEKDHFWNLSLVELSSLAEKRALTELIESFFFRKGATVEQVKVGAADLSCFTWNQGDHHYFTAFHRGIFLAGADSQIVAQAVRQLETPLAFGNSFFKKANKTATDNIDLNIYLNHKKLLQFSHSLFSETFCDRLKGSSQLAEWSEIDLTQKNSELLFNGFSFPGDSLNNYLGIFLHQKADTFNLPRIFPAKTSFFMSFVISNNTQFFDDYECLLDRRNGLAEYKKSLKEIDSLYNVDLQKIVIDNLDGAAAIVYTRPDSVLKDENKFLVLQAASGNKIESAMIPLTISADNNRKRNSSGNSSFYNIDKETVFKIYKTPVNDFGKRVFGDVFSSVKTDYFTVYDNCLIMGASYESLGQFLRANVLQETLENDQTYHAFTRGLSKRLNFYIWSTPGRSLPYFRDAINSELYQQIENQISDLQKMESVGWQIGVENGMVYNMAKLKYNPDVHESPVSVVWKSQLGSSIINRPQYVINPSDKAHREIVVQDADYNLTLMSNDGRVLWNIKLKGPIRSEVFQLNCLGDGKLQYFFNTNDALHLIDHEGHYVRNYPLLLRSAATNSVSVVDYDRNGDYRFFIACKDHKIYLYNKKGGIITGWKPEKTENDVFKPVQFFRVENKDYIVFTDKNRGYILDRKGKTRVVIKGEISYSRNPFTLEPGSVKRMARLVTSDSKGDIISVGFDGSVMRFPTRKFSSDHYFIYDAFNPEKKRDFIFVDGDSLVVFDAAVNKIFTKKFNYSIDLPPALYTFPDKSRRIGIADSTENRIYLFNTDGSICKGFPLEGNSGFAIDFSGRENDQYNLITGSSEGYLNNFLIK